MALWLRTVLESIDDGVIIVDVRGLVSHINPIAQQLTGWNSAEALGTPLHEIIQLMDSDTRCSLQDYMKQALKKNRALDFTHRALLLTRDERQIPVTNACRSIVNPEGDIAGTVLILRKEPEQEHLSRLIMQTRLSLIEYAAEHSLDELLTRALDKICDIVQSPIGFYHFVAADQKHLLLQQWSTLTKKEFCKAEGKGLHYNIDDAGVWVECVHRKQPVIHNDYKSLGNKKGMPDGHVNVIRELVVPVIREGKVVSILGVGNKKSDYNQKDAELVAYLADVIWQIVQQKRSEIELIQIQENLSLAQEMAQIGSWRYDLKTKELFWSHELYRICGLIPDDRGITMKLSLSMIHPEDRDYVQSNYKEMIKNGSSCNMYYRILRPDGEIRLVKGIGRIEKNTTGTVSSIYGTAQDITEQKLAEEEKARWEAHLNQSQKLESIGRLAGGVAHDLNNLLSPILGYSEILQAAAGPIDKYKGQIEQIVKAGLRARDLVHQLLAFSRKQALEFKLVDLNALLTNFEKLLRRTIREDIAIQMNLDGKLPFINGDPGQLEQVIMNLAVNAQAAMPDGGDLAIETRHVVLEEADGLGIGQVKPGSYALLMVNDTGYGMDTYTLEHLFEPFYTTNNSTNSTGLGLATTYGIVKQHNGYIRVESTSGKGATFWVYLPVSNRSVETSCTVSENCPDVSGSETILLVEDNDQVRELALVVLELKGYKVMAAHCGKEALSLLDRHSGKLHLLLTDVIMPEMNGKTLYEQVVQRYPDVKVLFMSGYTDDVLAPHGVMGHDVNFIPKPFPVRVLTEKVRKILDEQE